MINQDSHTQMIMRRPSSRHLATPRALTKCCCPTKRHGQRPSRLARRRSRGDDAGTGAAVQTGDRADQDPGPDRDGDPGARAGLLPGRPVAVRVPAGRRRAEADFIAAQDATAPRGPAGPATRRYLLAGLLARGSQANGDGTRQLTTPAETAGLIDQLRTAGVILTYDPDTLTICTRDDDPIAITMAGTADTPGKDTSGKEAEQQMKHPPRPEAERG